MRISSALIAAAFAVTFGLIGCKKKEEPAPTPTAAEPAKQPAAEPAAPVASERDRYVKAAIEIGCAAKQGSASDAGAMQEKHGFDAASFKTAAEQYASGAAMEIAEGLKSCK